MSDIRQTRRWRGIVGVALFAGAAGLLFKRPSVLLAAVVGVGYATYPQLLPAPTVDLALERQVAPETPSMGEAVEVTVTVENTGRQPLFDVRIVDGVPPMLSVIDGTPRHAAVLRPGATTTFSYTIEAEQGTHQFEPATVVARDLSGATEVETTVAAETTVECIAEVPEVPLRRQTGERVGQIVTDQGGSGIEFYRTREYQHGDQMNRIDWQRFARTGELTTIEFRQERAAKILLCLDVREVAFRAHGPDEPHAVSYSQAATVQLLDALRDTPDAVGLAALGQDSCWLAPGTGSEHYTRAREMLATHPALSAYAPDEDVATTERAREQVLELRQRLDADTQIVLLSPLTDDFVTETAYELEAAGHAVTVISPDVTTTDTPGGKLATTERRNAIRALREAGVPVFDWSPTERLGTTLAVAEGQ